MKFNLILMMATGVLAMSACRPVDEGGAIPLPTSICLQAMHHDVPIPDVNIFLKYQCDEFPGYDRPEHYYDTMLVSDANGRICVSPVPPGNHWAVAFGASEHGIPLPIFGRLPIVIDLKSKPKVDTMLFMYE